MKNKNKVIKVFSIITLVVVFLFSAYTFADVGNINRYDSDSHNSSSSSSSSSSNYTKSDYSSSSSSSSSGGSSISTYVFLGIVFVVILYFYGKSKGKINGIKDLTNISKMKEVYSDFKNDVGESTASTNTLTPFEKRMAESDPNFSYEKFLSWASDVFIKLQQAWTERDWKIIRPFESNELFEQHSAQLQEYIDNNKINVIERISIIETDISDYRIEGDKEIIEVVLAANLKDYIIDATTKEVVEGDKNKDWEMVYSLTFYRKNGVKTKAGSADKVTTNCPNCGAPTQITSAGQCEYCNSVVTTGEHDWVLCKLVGRQC